MINELFDVIDDKKTDEVEIDFVLDQRTSRKMWIGLVTEEVVKYIPEFEVEEVTTEEPEHYNFEEDLVIEDDDEEDEEIVNYKKLLEKKDIKEKRKNKKAKMLRLMKAVETAERVNLTPYLASRMINDVHAALGVITEDDQENVMYRMKFSRLVATARRHKIQEKKGRCPEGLMFDERKDTVKEKVVDGHKYEFEEVKREKIVLWSSSLEGRRGKRSKIDKRRM